jgi:putative hydrolase of the HAD superfamily
MIKAISFDLYNTLVQFWPPLDEVQQSACRELGLRVCKTGIKRGYAVADVYFNEENARRSLGLRSEEERLDFFARYEQIILENAGVPVTFNLAKQVWAMAMTIPKDFVPFDDTIPALASLHEQGYLLGVLSNLRRDMSQLCESLGFAPYLDFCISPSEPGGEKPDATMFNAALKRASVEAKEAVHVGDQYRSDVLGARGVGMHGVLIDRGGWLTDEVDCPKIASLSELHSLLADAPQSLCTNHRKS